MRRREFIMLLGGAVAWPLAARAQERERPRRIAVLMGYAESGSSGQALIAAFRDGLQKFGWTEGHNTRIDIRWAAPDDAESIRTRRATTRSHYFEHHTHHSSATTTNANHPHHFSGAFRSGRQRLRRELLATWRQRHRVQRFGADTDGQAGGTAQGDCAACWQDRDAVQPGVSAIYRILAESLQSHRCAVGR